MTDSSRTRDRALAELMDLLPELAKEVDAHEVKKALTADLVAELFKIAWDNQFNDDRNATSRLLRQVVKEALENVRD